MAANHSVIGRTTRVQGRVTGSVDLDVNGFVDGEIVVDGNVTVDEHGMVGAGVQARRVVVRGAVRGGLVGQEAVLLEDGARVVGDLRAPRIAIAPGALVRGFVQTGESDGTAPRAASKALPKTREAPAPPSKSTIKSAISVPSKPVDKQDGAASSTNRASASPRRPPPPVVPALKKARGQIAKRKER